MTYNEKAVRREDIYWHVPYMSSEFALADSLKAQQSVDCC